MSEVQPVSPKVEENDKTPVRTKINHFHTIIHPFDPLLSQFLISFFIIHNVQYCAIEVKTRGFAYIWLFFPSSLPCSPFSVRCQRAQIEDARRKISNAYLFPSQRSSFFLSNHREISRFSFSCICAFSRENLHAFCPWHHLTGRECVAVELSNKLSREKRG